MVRPLFGRYAGVEVQAVAGVMGPIVKNNMTERLAVDYYLLRRFS